ncbi:MAG TPA: hypothetical protein VF402_04730 [Asticcacaulis sp.]
MLKVLLGGNGMGLTIANANRRLNAANQEAVDGFRAAATPGRTEKPPEAGPQAVFRNAISGVKA